MRVHCSFRFNIHKLKCKLYSRNTKIGALLAVDLKTDKTGEPSVHNMTLKDLPSSMGFRPHGLHIDNVSQRVFAVSHSTLLQEESIFVFDIHPRNTSRIPELQFRYKICARSAISFLIQIVPFFLLVCCTAAYLGPIRYALTSSNFTWINGDNLYFLNDVAAVDGISNS